MAAAETVTRPALRWHGGKYLLAPWVCSLLPPHKIYVEPFGGAASVLLRKPRSYSEIYNDLDSEVVNLFRVLRSADGQRLVEALRLTPYARDEFELAYGLAEEPFELARRLVIRSFMGFGSDGHNRLLRTGFRANANRSGTTPAHDWANYPSALEVIVRRLTGVVIENRPALRVMAQHDAAHTLHYVDPPYMPGTRSAKTRAYGGKYHAYTHEMVEADHVELLQFLTGARGMVVLSGYHTELYDDTLTGWQRHEREALADGARPRTEVLWLNPASADALAKIRRAKHDAPRMFDHD